MCDLQKVPAGVDWHPNGADYEPSGRYFYVPMAVNSEGNGPADPEETTSVIHQVWDDEFEVICSCPSKTLARAIAASMNSEEAASHVIANMVWALQECADYFDDRADADSDSEGYHPNKEMQLLAVCRRALGETE